MRVYVQYAEPLHSRCLPQDRQLITLKVAGLHIRLIEVGGRVYYQNALIISARGFCAPQTLRSKVQILTKYPEEVHSGVGESLTTVGRGKHYSIGATRTPQ